MTSFPMLFKRTSTGAIQFWHITAYDRGGDLGARIETTYGQDGTDSPQTTVDDIKTGKNAGKANETSAYQQADKEARAQWEKKKKRSYVELLDDAKAGKVDTKSIKGGADPMLAHKYADHAHKITFPCYAQPKLDGIRCIAVIKDGKATLWTRTRKQITSLPHIVEQLEANSSVDQIIDGELYNHAYKDRFSEIVSMVRQKDKVHPNHTDVQYHVYDVIANLPFSARIHEFNKVCEGVFVKAVHTILIADEECVSKALDAHLGAGYEGTMLRNASSTYKPKRSYDLQKVKTFDDAEFKILGVEEGRGNLMGHVGAFVCIGPGGTKFKAKMSGERSYLKELFEDSSLWRDKTLTVQYQGMTDKNSVPRFPVGLQIRDYE